MSQQPRQPQQQQGLLGGLLQPVTDTVGGLTGGQGLGGVLEPVTGAVGQATEGLGKALGNIGGETGKRYDPDEIGYYRQIMERQGPPMVYSNKQLRERLEIEKELGQLRQQQLPQPPEYMGQLIQIPQTLMQLQIEQGYQLRQILQYLQHK